MRFKELLNLYTDTDVVNSLVRLYPDENRLKQRASYCKVLRELRLKRVRDTGMTLVLTKQVDDDMGSYVDLTGSDKANDRWALDFISRSTWLGLEVPRETIKKFKPLDILAHALFEMCWHGFAESEVKNRIESMHEIVKKIKDDV